VTFVEKLSRSSSLRRGDLLGRIGIGVSKYYTWKERQGQANRHNGKIPKGHWLRPEERQAIVDFAQEQRRTGVLHLRDGYRRIAYAGIDAGAFAVSPATVYTVLKAEGLLLGKNGTGSTSKGKGFTQPTRPHQHWHTDIKYLSYKGRKFFFISAIDGYSRCILHHEVRQQMTVADVEIVLQRAKEKYPQARAQVISDNGGQYVSQDFATFIRLAQMTHARTSPSYPQSNGKIERFHRTLEEECLQVQSMISFDDLCHQIQTFVEHYNTKRLHSAIGYLPPMEVLMGRAEELLQKREQKMIAALEERKAYWLEQREAKKAA
jgi:transposase InsO family protein